MTKLKSFGCSFFYGTDLHDVDFPFPSDVSNSTWPALIAQQLGLDYTCYAWPGQGNFKIYCDILANSYGNDDSIYVINWTWMDRFDYVDTQERWQTLRPAQENATQEFYYRNLHSQLQDRIASASWIVSAAEHLTSLGCPFVMTYIDHDLIMPIDKSWHDPRYLEILQKKLSKILVNFEGMNFIDWSRKKSYPVSTGWHPLEAAHAAAAEFWLPHIQSLAHTNNR
jgi:hypothetical protein